MIVRLDFERDFVFVVKVYDARIVHKGGAHPGRGDFFGGGAEVSFEQAVNFVAGGWRLVASG